MPDPDAETAQWKASFAWADVEVQDGRAIMKLHTFEKLADYSCTVPDGVFIGKRWRRREPYVNQRDGSNVWFMGEYAKDDDPERAKIVWREIWITRDGATVRATNMLLNAVEVERALSA